MIACRKATPSTGRALEALVGCRIRASSPQGRFREGAAKIDGGQLRAVEAYGKHLLIGIGGGFLHVHLGLAGTMFRSDPAAKPRRGVRLRLVAGNPLTAWDLAAPLRCELFSPEQVGELVRRLGPDPLRGDDPAPAFARITRSARPIGELLLDQSVIAGIGNVLRAETLHRCGLHPGRPGTVLSNADLCCLWMTLTRFMRRGVEEGRIITVEDDDVDRLVIPENEGRFVYKQQYCRTCGNTVCAFPLGGRVAYACENCQPVGA